MTTGKGFTILFATTLALAVLGLSTVASTAWASAPSLDRLVGLQPIHQAEEPHRPGLPEEGQLRVYWFWSATSHCSRGAEPSIEALIDQFDDVEVIVVHSNADEDVALAQRVAAERELSFAIYRDQRARLAIALDARMTPEVVVVDHTGVIYKGRPEMSRRGRTQSYVQEAIEAWMAGEEVEQAYRRPSGCVIRRP